MRQFVRVEGPKNQRTEVPGNRKHGKLCLHFHLVLALFGSLDVSPLGSLNFADCVDDASRVEEAENSNRFAPILHSEMFQSLAVTRPAKPFRSSR
jgi:hypothetical protein